MRVRSTNASAVGDASAGLISHAQLKRLLTDEDLLLVERRQVRRAGPGGLSLIDRLRRFRFVHVMSQEMPALLCSGFLGASLH